MTRGREQIARYAATAEPTVATARPIATSTLRGFVTASTQASTVDLPSHHAVGHIARMSNRADQVVPAEGATFSFVNILSSLDIV
jgi:hypothetical protein